MRVFEAFPDNLVPYRFLKLSRGEVYGNRIVKSRDLIGLFKSRAGIVSVGDRETRESSSTMHVKPEDFEITGALEDFFVGNGIEYLGSQFEIIGATEGKNHEGVVEHFRLTLERTKNVNESVS